MQNNDNSKRITFIGASVNFILFAIKVAVGIVGHSGALIADGIHSLSDLATDGAVLMGIELAQKPSDSSHPYGHGKFESLFAFIVGVVLAVVAFEIGYEAIIEIRAGDLPIPSVWVLVVALISIAAKELLYRYTIAIGQRERKLSVIANAYHHRSDALSSCAVLLGTGAAVASSSLKILEPVAALAVAALILFSAIKIIRMSCRVLLDASLPAEFIERLHSTALKDNRVLYAHKVRGRDYAGYFIADMHIGVDGAISVREGHKIAHEVKKRIMEAFPEVVELNIHIEPADSNYNR